ncbi:MAG: D-xylose ABC transporter ATP-binding protein [Blastopirellula sp.]|nr:MAG: D-xylose ABC transporter ATP-binding protein [Blastopirellula sp.]
MPQSKSALLEVRSLSKRFPGVQALSNISLSIAAGESVAVIGENGAGKSTLMKILAGIQSQDTGQILIDGKQVRISSPREAQEFGIALIHQELNLCDNLDVGANIFLGREPRTLGFINHTEIYKRSEEVLKQVGLDVSPNTLTSELPIGKQQLIEIAKSLSANARLIIMDEPTSSLSTKEVGALFEVIKNLKAQGVSIVYISHRLGEVIEVADRVVAMRDGEYSGELTTKEITHDNMVRLMIGRELDEFYARVSHTPGEVVLKVDQVQVPGNAQHKISFQVRAGEIVGVAGLVGAGRTELVQVLFGFDRALGGTVHVCGKRIALKSTRDAIQAGMFLVPEDRKQHGLIIEMMVRENISLPGLARHATAGMVDQAYEIKNADEMIKKLGVKTPNQEQITQFLSGGNQQKVVIAKWLSLGPKVLLLDEPTRGIDIGAKHEIYEMMEDLAKRGVAILFVSSEMEEVIGMSDRTLVMHEGQIAGELSRDQLNEESIMQLATGQQLITN